MIHIFNKNKLAWRIRATFAGKLPPREHITPDIRCNNPGWGDESFNRIIEKLDFFIPTGHRLVLEGMEKYNFFIEAMQTIGKLEIDINAFYFCGKRPGEDMVDMFKIKNNTVLHEQKKYGAEWNNTPIAGWKPGVPAKPMCYITRL